MNNGTRDARSRLTGGDKTVLLTGATGFVGRHLDAALAETSWSVRRATRNREKSSEDGWVRLDVEDSATIRCESFLHRF